MRLVTSLLKVLEHLRGKTVVKVYNLNYEFNEQAGSKHEKTSIIKPSVSYTQTDEKLR